MARPIQAAATDVTLYFLAVEIATGAVVTAGIAYDAAGLELAYTRLREATVKAVVGDTPAPASLASDTATHTNWGWRHVGNGLHRADFPDEAFASGSAGVVCMPKLTGYQFIQVDPNLIMAVDPVADNSAELADAFLDRNLATGTDSGSSTVRTVRQALRALRNRFTVSGGTATFYKEDDATVSHTAAVTGTPAVTEANPAGGS
ncbi:hypothetical protein [Gemmatimonas sp. UBA7669]|uniref:hypothetical protein n=1 Tax=Gemmatimonas sp. UBA7669 TaxID=1946568 RepID=UPI0025BD3B9A|nr:hypothetical protein [Gemmatimonas sp. UBA7669]